MKLSLEDLEVQSFVTALSDAEKRQMKGGTQPTYTCGDATAGCPQTCPTHQQTVQCSGGYCTCESGCSVTHCAPGG